MAVVNARPEMQDGLVIGSQWVAVNTGVTWTVFWSDRDGMVRGRMVDDRTGEELVIYIPREDWSANFVAIQAKPAARVCDYCETAPATGYVRAYRAHVCRACYVDHHGGPGDLDDE